MGDAFRYLYTLQSVPHPDRFYVGMTQDLSARLAEHNAGHVTHTSKFPPWRTEVAVAFRSKGKAAAFEKYLKSHSGRAFARRHF